MCKVEQCQILHPEERATTKVNLNQIEPISLLPYSRTRAAVTPPGVHKLMILLRDLVKENLQNIFGEEMGGGQEDPDPLIKTTPRRF